MSQLQTRSSLESIQHFCPDAPAPPDEPLEPAEPLDPPVPESAEPPPPSSLPHAIATNAPLSMQTHPHACTRFNTCHLPPESRSLEDPLCRSRPRCELRSQHTSRALYEARTCRRSGSSSRPPTSSLLTTAGSGRSRAGQRVSHCSPQPRSRASLWRVAFGSASSRPLRASSHRRRRCCPRACTTAFRRRRPRPTRRTRRTKPATTATHSSMPRWSPPRSPGRSPSPRLIVPATPGASCSAARSRSISSAAHCGSRLVLRALIAAAESVARFLRNIGEHPNPPPIAPARAPPLFRMPALRRSAAELFAGTSCAGAEVCALSRQLASSRARVVPATPKQSHPVQSHRRPYPINPGIC